MTARTCKILRFAVYCAILCLGLNQVEATDIGGVISNLKNCVKGILLCPKNDRISIATFIDKCNENLDCFTDEEIAKVSKLSLGCLIKLTDCQKLYDDIKALVPNNTQ